MGHLRKYSTLETPQSKPLPGQVPNSAGGHAWELDDWKRLERFLILGSDGGTYYISEQELTQQNAEVVRRCIDFDPFKTVDIIVDVSHNGRAPKNDTALFALAMVSKLANQEGRAYANQALPRVARIGTHLLHYAAFIQQFGGWGSGTVRSFQRWFTEKTPEDVAFQAIKYASRNGWAFSDLLRQSHPKSQAHNAVFKYIVDGVEPDTNLEFLPRIIKGTELIKSQKGDPKVAASLISEYNLPREVVPTELLNDLGVWNALLYANMGLAAVVRNLGKMTNIGLLKGNSAEVHHIIELLSEDRIKKSRLHPLAILVAMKIYQQGHGDKGSLSWKPVRQVVDALDAAFYLSFQNVTPTGKNHLLALDISGSMGWDSIAGMPLTPMMASAALALITANVEPNYEIVAFTNTGSSPSMHRGYASGISPLDISPRQRLDDVLKVINKLKMGGTDCALPMVYATEKKLEIDAFLIYTDNETWAGNIHPKQALDQYRKQSNRQAKVAVVGMASNGFSIADPNDFGMMDVVGFDTATPAVIADFVRSGM